MDRKAITKNFDSIWQVVTSNGALEKSFAQQGKAINLTIEPILSKKWFTLPKTSAHYFPADSADSYWNWKDYTKDCFDGARRQRRNTGRGSHRRACRGE